MSAASRELGSERKDAERAVQVASLSDEAKDAAQAAGLDDNDPPFRTVMARINFEGWRELRRLSIDTDEPLEQMINPSLNRLVEDAGRIPPIEHRRAQKEIE